MSEVPPPDESVSRVPLVQRVTDSIRKWYGRFATQICAGVAAAAVIIAVVVGPPAGSTGQPPSGVSLPFAEGSESAEPGSAPGSDPAAGANARSGEGASGGIATALDDASGVRTVDGGAFDVERPRSSSVAGADVERSTAGSPQSPGADATSDTTTNPQPSPTTTPRRSTPSSTPTTTLPPSTGSPTTTVPPTSSTSLPVPTSTTTTISTTTTTTTPGGGANPTIEYRLLSFDVGAVSHTDSRLATYGASLDSAASSCVGGDRTTLGTQVLAAAELLRNSGVNESALDVMIRLRIAGEASLVRQPCGVLLDSIATDLLGG